MAFSAKKYLESLEPPTYIDEDSEGNEIIFTGKLVPFNDAVQIVADLQKLSDSSTMADVDQLVERTVKVIQMDEAVLPYIQRLPIEGRLTAVLDFLECLRGRKRPTTPQ